MVLLKSHRTVIPLGFSLVWLQLEYCFSFWAPQVKRGTDKLKASKTREPRRKECSSRDSLKNSLTGTDYWVFKLFFVFPALNDVLTEEKQVHEVTAQKPDQNSRYNDTVFSGLPRGDNQLSLNSRINQQDRQDRTIRIHNARVPCGLHGRPGNNRSPGQHWEFKKTLTAFRSWNILHSTSNVLGFPSLHVLGNTSYLLLCLFVIITLSGMKE